MIKNNWGEAEEAFASFGRKEGFFDTFLQKSIDYLKIEEKIKENRGNQGKSGVFEGKVKSETRVLGDNYFQIGAEKGI